MERLRIQHDEPVTVGEVKAFLSQFGDDEQVTIPANLPALEFSIAGSLDTGVRRVNIVPRD